MSGGASGAGGAGSRRKPSSHKRRWGTIIEAARAARMSRFMGRSRSEDSVCDHARPSPRYRVLYFARQLVRPSGRISMIILGSSGSERSESGSDSQRSPERGRARRSRDSRESESRGSTRGGPLSALAALKRKRKKFSDSRRAEAEARGEVRCHLCRRPALYRV